MTKEQFTKIIKWQDKTFPGASALSKIAHLKEEVNELSTAITANDDGLSHEIADCLFLIFGTAYKAGMSYEDVLRAIDEKYYINIHRGWGNPDENGVVKHTD